MNEPDLDVQEQRRSIGARRNPETETAVLDAAEAILLADGLAGFSIEAVARRARAGKPTIYRWWPSKALLLLDVYHRQKPAAVHADTGSVEGDVQHFLSSLLGHWAHSPGGQLFRYLIAEAQHDDGVAAAMRDYAAGRRQQTGAIFRRGIERGELRADIDVELAAETLAAIAWQRLLLGRLDAGDSDIAAIADQIIGGMRP